MPKKLTKREMQIASQTIPEEMGKFPRAQAIAIGINRAREIARSEKVASLVQEYTPSHAKRSTPMIAPIKNADQDAARELKLFTENDGDIYRQQGESILKNLTKKKAVGSYNPELAEKLFMYLCETGAKKYARTFGHREAEWSRMFTVPTRQLVARKWREEFDVHFTEGQYDSYIPKKYQATAKQTASTVSKSVAYLSGQKDGKAFIRSVDPSADLLKILVARNPETKNPSQELNDENPPAKVAKKLGVTVTSVKKYDPHFNHACKEYDEGYLRVCQQMLDAMEGN
jgi:hypothetical protein